MEENEEKRKMSAMHTIVLLMDIEVQLPETPENMTSVYFAHPTDKQNSKREQMIKKILEERGYFVIDPFELENDLLEKYGVDNYYDKPTKDFARDIVFRDYASVKACDELFAWIPKTSSALGTPIEITWAFELGKNVTILADVTHPFAVAYADILYVGYSNFKNDIKHEWEI